MHVQYPYIAMSPDSYVLLIEPQLNLCTHPKVLHYCENVYLLRHRSEHTCTSAVYYQVCSAIKALHCKAKYEINMNPNTTLLDTADLSFLFNIAEPWTLVCALENRPYLFEYFTYREDKRMEFCECSFFGPYYLALKMFSCQNNAVATDG